MRFKWRLKKYGNLLIVAALAAVFFVATSSFNYLTQDKNYTKWTSPDETANYYFAKSYATTGRLAIFDPASAIGGTVVMPRSVRNDFGWIKPVSFLGIILIYGTIASFFGVGIIPFLTPFFAALGLMVFYLLARRLFKGRVALVATFLLAVFPVYIYYTVRSMFHNILFIVLLLAGAYLFSLALGQKKEKIKAGFLSLKPFCQRWPGYLASFGSGLFVGLAVITRTSELLWLGPVFFLVWLFYARRFGWVKLVLFLAGLFLALLPVAYYNQILYGSFLHGGYNEMNRSIDDISKSSNQLLTNTLAGRFQQLGAYLKPIGQNIFYFGFNARQSLSMFRHYVLDMFPLWVYAGGLGFFILVIQNIRRFRRKYLVYVLVWSVLSVILIFYYGSWRFNDNPNPNSFTIGNSYTRYWLPIYLMLIPLAALAIVKVSRALLLITKKTQSRIRPLIAGGLQAAAIIVAAFLSLVFVLYGSEEGLAYLYYNNLAERTNTERVFAYTQPAGIIITQYYDKFFWPERRIIMGTLPNAEILSGVKNLVKYYPVYYYNFYLNAADVTYLNERKFTPYNLEMKLVKKINARFGLYELYAKNK